ncbi:hypothetical protein [Endozoicomonas ascidiicola]|uniref:hypothetical protein n=1 Tax=Endozoicomonas ascidiicola TaxID=1698521 RepID=UPI000AD03371|nr:hypothetical protein [Endozoicomonas ascidiicola]
MKRYLNAIALSTVMLITANNSAYGYTDKAVNHQKPSAISNQAISREYEEQLDDYEKDALKSTIMQMFEKLNTFNFQEFTDFFPKDSLNLLKHQVLSHAEGKVFNHIFPEGKGAARTLSPSDFFSRIVSKSKLNVGITRPYEINVSPELTVNSNVEGDIVTVTAIFPDSYNTGHENRSEILTFRKQGGEWRPEPPDFILSSFRYDLLEDFSKHHVYFPFSPFITEGFKIIYSEVP